MVKAEEILNRVKAARAGEMAAWNDLYQAYYPRLLNIALYYCGNTATAKDLVQDTFITAFLKLHQLKEASLFGAWIKKILTRKYYRVTVNESFTETDVINNIAWEQQLEETETHTKLKAAMAGLPEVLKTTLLLRYFSSRRSYNEIAEILSVPVGTVRSRLNEAKAKLSAAWHQPLKSTADQDTWNQFYQQTLSGLHHNAEQRRIFLQHLQQRTRVAAPGNRLIANGRSFFEGLVANDQACGSWLAPVDIISSGPVTVIEQKHFNSAEYPHHCPPSCVVIIYREKGLADRIHVHACGR
jgi:RNA polymerase sigma factor (sigma-70 family)